MLHTIEGTLVILKADVALTAVVPAKAIVNRAGNNTRLRTYPRVMISQGIQTLDYELDSKDINDDRLQISAFSRATSLEAEQVADLVYDALRGQKPSADDGVTYLMRLVNRISVDSDTEFAVHLDYRLLAAR